MERPYIDRALRRAVRPVLHRFGLEVVRYDARHFLHLHRASLLREYGVDVVLDVGANDGSFARGLRSSGYRGKIVSFEPLPTAFAKLEQVSAADGHWECRRLALGSYDGEASLHVAGNSSSSSLLDMTPQHVRSAPESAYVSTETVAVARLDSIRAGFLDPADRLYVKVDVQGLELDVLRGAEETLGQAIVVDAEISLVPLYSGAPTYDQVIDYLTERGFGARALEPVFVDPDSGRILQLDGIFAR